MRNLELNEMELIQGESGGFWTAFSCGLTVLAAGAFIAGTGGTGALVGAYVAGAVCGGLFGEAAATGTFE